MAYIIKSLRKLASALETDPITAQEIYDFYAILGSSTEEFFQDKISNFAQKVYSGFHKALVNHPSPAFTGGLSGVPSLEQWKAWGGSESLYTELLDAFIIEFYEDFETKKFVGKVQEPLPWLSDLSLSDEETDQLYKILSKRKDTWFSGGETWARAWKLFKTYSDDLFSSNLGKRILAIDVMLSLVHHGGSMLVHHVAEGELGIREALDAKFKAKTPADFWDRVDPKLRIQINKVRRSELLLPIIILE